MHIPKIYRIEDQEIIKDFIRQNGFATIVSSVHSCPVATHIPLDLQQNGSGDQVLWGHVSKGNPQWKEFVKNPKVLAIFLSHIHAYISSSWYNHPNVPTWNYMSVHVTGTVSLLEGEKLWDSVRKLTDKYEKDSEQPVSLDRLPEQVQRQMNGLVGFEIKIQKMDCAFKLSQNRNREDLENIISQLNLREDASSKLMAEVMQEKVIPGKLNKNQI
jgi:transcriptional regulator